MKTLCFMLLVFLAILALVCGCGLVVGLLLHWAIPAIGVEIGMLIGVVAVGWAGYWFGKITQFANKVWEEESSIRLEKVILTPLRPPRSARRRGQRADD